MREERLEVCDVIVDTRLLRLCVRREDAATGGGRQAGTEGRIESASFEPLQEGAKGRARDADVAGGVAPGKPEEREIPCRSHGLEGEAGAAQFPGDAAQLRFRGCFQPRLNLSLSFDAEWEESRDHAVSDGEVSAARHTSERRASGGPGQFEVPLREHRAAGFERERSVSTKCVEVDPAGVAAHAEAVAFHARKDAKAHRRREYGGAAIAGDGKGAGLHTPGGERCDRTQPGAIEVVTAQLEAAGPWPDVDAKRAGALHEQREGGGERASVELRDLAGQVGRHRNAQVR